MSLKDTRDEAVGIAVGAAAALATTPVAFIEAGIDIAQGTPVNEALTNAADQWVENAQSAADWGKENADVIVQTTSVVLSVDGAIDRHSDG